jgi:beta-1,4-mannosyltransferase
VSRAAVAAFPRTVRGNPYCDLLYGTLAARGVAVTAGAELSPRWLLRHVRDVKVLHLHWPEFYYRSGGQPTARSVTAFVAALLLARLLRYRVVWTVHNALPHERHVVDRPLRWLLVHSARLVVQAEAARVALPQTRQLAAVVPHGHYIGCYPDDLSAADARRTLGLAASDRVFVCFGQLRAYKDVGALLDAFARLPGPSLHLVIAGRPATEADAEIIRTAVRRDGRVQTHLAFVSDPDVQRFLKAADFVVLPYRDVLTSGAALLALSFARPLVVSRRGCLVELEHEGCAIGYDPDAPDGLRAALAAAAAIPDLGPWQQRAATAARRRAWEPIAEAYARIYRGG